MYDVLIIGAGPSGLTAAIYAKRCNLDVAIVELGAPGGAMVNTAMIENYPGISKIDGASLSMQMFEQAINLGVVYLGEEANKIDKDDEKFLVTFSSGNKVESRTVIVATGTKQKKLNVLGEDKFSGYGISWCAICDGSFYKNKDVAVVGGGNSALEEALYLSEIANKVYIIHRREEFRGDNIVVNKLKEKNNVIFVLNSVIKEFAGDKKLGKIRLENIKENRLFEINVEGCFEYVGSQPNNDIVADFNIVNENGYIDVNENFETTIKGLYACGDIVNKKIRQIATAVNDGAIAALSANKYCKE